MTCTLIYRGEVSHQARRLQPFVADRNTLFVNGGEAQPGSTAHAILSTELLDLSEGGSGESCEDAAVGAPHSLQQAVTFVSSGEKENAVVCGGYSYENGISFDFNTCLEYDVASDIWITWNNKMAKKRFGAAGTYVRTVH